MADRTEEDVRKKALASEYAEKLSKRREKVRNSLTPEQYRFFGRLENVTLTIPEKGIIRITGGSGLGKTTLLGIIAGTLAPDAGERVGFERLPPAIYPWDMFAETQDGVRRDAAAE